MRTFIILMLCINLFSCANKPENATNIDAEKISFKNWALSRCLSEISNDSAGKQDALNTASSYLEKSNMQLEAFTEADKLVKAFVSKNYSGSIPGTFNTQKCIDLFHSHELENLYQSLTN